jgi:hypothetical protein
MLKCDVHSVVVFQNVAEEEVDGQTQHSVDWSKYEKPHVFKVIYLLINSQLQRTCFEALTGVKP